MEALDGVAPDTLLLLGGGVALVGLVWLLVAAFRISKLWGVALLCANLAPPAAFALLSPLLAIVALGIFAVALIAFVLVNVEKTWIPVVLIVTGNLLAYKGGGLPRLQRKLSPPPVFKPLPPAPEDPRGTITPSHKGKK